MWGSIIVYIDMARLDNERREKEGGKRQREKEKEDE
jgi:hypothetical protein